MKSSLLTALLENETNQQFHCVNSALLVLFMCLFFSLSFPQGLSAKPMTIKTALFRIIFVWLFALAWTLMPMFGWNRYVSELSVWFSSYEIE
jgi:hypothetical protein